MRELPPESLPESRFAESSGFEFFFGMPPMSQLRQLARPGCVPDEVAKVKIGCTVINPQWSARFILCRQPTIDDRRLEGES
jgi:hypothetical protein